jgi:hypothetical protein
VCSSEIEADDASNDEQDGGGFEYGEGLFEPEDTYQDDEGSAQAGPDGVDDADF